jgi:hypothetical protein
MNNPSQGDPETKGYDIFFFGHVAIDIIKTPSKECVISGIT